MKRLFFAPDATGTTSTTSAPAPTSEKLTALTKQHEETYDKMLAAGKSPEGRSLMLEVFKVEKLIDAEKASIRNEAAAQVAAEARAAKLAVIAEFKDAVISNYKASIGKGSPDEKNAANDAEKAVSDKLANGLLGSRPAAKKAEGTASESTGTRGGKSAEIRQHILNELAKDGMTVSQAVKNVVEMGYTTGTTTTERTKMKNEGLFVQYGENPLAAK